jgi:hypothetical protein
MVKRIHCGINTDPENPGGNPSVQDIKDLGATWVRFTFRDLNGGSQPTAFGVYDELVQNLHQAGIKILMILSYETYPGKWECDADATKWDAYIAKFAARCRQVAEHYGSHVQAYEVWNEPDHPPQPGYNPYVPAETFGPLLRNACTEIKAVSDATVVMGGLAWGQPAYLQAVQTSTAGVLHADAVGVHPYGRRPTQDWPHPGWGGLSLTLTELIQDYYDVAPKPIWITEVGLDAPDASFLAEFLRRTLEALRANVSEIAPYAFWFCWSDGMKRDFGLIDLAGTPKAPYDAFRAFVASIAAAEATLFTTLLQRAEAEQRIQFNPDAALQRRIFAAGFVPNSGEFSIPFGSVTYIAQRAEHLESGEVRVYYVQAGLWDAVWFLPRPTGEAAGPTVTERPSVHSSSRNGEDVRYIVVHSSDSPVGVPAEDTLTYLVGPNADEGSAHEVALPGGQVYRLVPDELATNHFESQNVQLPDGTSGQLANKVTWSIQAYQIRGKAVGQEVLAATTERVVAACKRLGLDHNSVLGAGEVAPDSPEEPAGVDMDAFRAAVADLLLQDALLAGAEANQVMQFNPDAALQQTIFGDGFVPNSGEFAVSFEGDTYFAQRAEHLESGAVRVYYAREHEWDKVQCIERG